MHKNTVDLAGHRYGRLTVLTQDANRNGKVFWKVRCDCGNTAAVQSSNLRSGNTISCGCEGSRHTIGERSFKHGKRDHPLFSVWWAMKQRCYDPNTASFKNYGGRGIHVCKTWQFDFQAFFDDMASTWKAGLTLERKNNNGNYSPRNCRWATRREQLLNFRRNHLIKTKWGKLPISEAARRAGLNCTTVRMRISYGWSESRLLDPVQH